MALNFDGMSINRMLAQRVMPRLDGGRLGEKAYMEEVTALVDAGVGGFVLFGGDYWEVRKFIPKLQARAKVPLIIASDMERGVGQQLGGATPFPCQMAVAAGTDVASGDGLGFLSEMIEGIAAEARGAGVNAILGPVMDVNSMPENPIICTRAFSDEPTNVSALGTRYIKGLQDAKNPVMACAKHFPGHGETAVDSHMRLPVVEKDKDNLEEQDMLPFRKAVMAGVEMVMTGHLMVPDIDPDHPASLSAKLTRIYLRNRAGFDGLVVTDALDMGALAESYTPREAARLAIKAGADILLHPADPAAFLAELYDLAKNKEITKEEVMAPAAMLKKVKSRYCGPSRLTDAQVKELLDKDAGLASTIAQRAITLVKAGGAFPVLKEIKGKVAHIVLEDDGDTKAGRVIRSKLSSRHKKLGNLFVTRSRALKLKDEALARAGEADLVVLSVFSGVRAGKGSSGLSQELVDLGRQLVRLKKRKSVVISFSSPYILNKFMDAEHVVAAYDSSDAMQEAVCRAFTGEIVFRGELPVRI